MVNLNDSFPFLGGESKDDKKLMVDLRDFPTALFGFVSYFMTPVDGIGE